MSLTGEHPTYTLSTAPAELVKRFYELKYIWWKETAHMSDTGRMYRHWAYKEITAMGWPIVGVIFQEMAMNYNFWFGALRKITGVNPVQKENAGIVWRMCLDWENWAFKNGYLSMEA